MRLYVNNEEIPILKSAIRDEINTLEKTNQHYDNQMFIDRLGDLYERIELCEQLQKNCRRAKQ